MPTIYNRTPYNPGEFEGRVGVTFVEPASTAPGFEVVDIYPPKELSDDEKLERIGVRVDDEERRAYALAALALIEERLAEEDSGLPLERRHMNVKRELMKRYHEDAPDVVDAAAWEIGKYVLLAWAHKLRQFPGELLGAA